MAPGRKATGSIFTFNVLLLSSVSFLNDVSSEIIFPLLPLFVILGTGGGLNLGAAAGAFVVGIIEGLRESTSSFFKIIGGYWSDRIGRRKFLVAGGYGLSSLTKLAFPFIYVWQVLVGVAIVERLGKGIREAPRDAILADSVALPRRGKVFGLHRTADTTGAALGPIVALLLFPTLGFRGVFLVAILPALAAAALALGIRETKRMAARGAPPLRISLRSLRPELKAFLAVATLFAVGNFSVFFLLLKVVVGEQPGTPEAEITAVEHALLLYLAFNVVYAAVSIPAGHLSDRLGRLPIIFMGYGAFAATALGFILAPGNPLIFLVLFVMFGLAYGLIEGVQRAFVADLSPPNLRSTSLGTYHTMTGLAKFPASFIFGFLWSTFNNPSASFSYSLATALGASVLLILMIRKFPRAVLESEAAPTGPPQPPKEAEGL